MNNFFTDEAREYNAIINLNLLETANLFDNTIEFKFQNNKPTTWILSDAAEALEVYRELQKRLSMPVTE